MYYPYGGGLAQIWTDHVPDVKAVAEVTGASIENVKLADRGETVIGEIMGDSFPAPGWTVIFNIVNGPHHLLSIFVGADDGIQAGKSKVPWILLIWFYNIPS